MRGIKAGDGSWVTDPLEIKEAFRSHFMEILQKDNSNFPIDQEWMSDLPRLSDDQIRYLSSDPPSPMKRLK